VLEGARRTLANDWFLDACARVERGEETWPRFDLKLWAACKLVLRLAGKRPRAGSGTRSRSAERERTPPRRAWTPAPSRVENRVRAIEDSPHA
jgi:hypothetical protein